MAAKYCAIHQNTAKTSWPNFVNQCATNSAAAFHAAIGQNRDLKNGNSVYSVCQAVLATSWSLYWWPKQMPKLIDNACIWWNKLNFCFGESLYFSQLPFHASTEGTGFVLWRLSPAQPTPFPTKPSDEAISICLKQGTFHSSCHCRGSFLFSLRVWTNSAWQVRNAFGIFQYDSWHPSQNGLRGGTALSGSRQWSCLCEVISHRSEIINNGGEANFKGNSITLCLPARQGFCSSGIILQQKNLSVTAAFQN